MKRQPMIPGLEGLENATDNAERKRQTLEKQMKALEHRVLVLELEVSKLKVLLQKAKSPDGQPDCYFYSNDRCLGRPAESCQWAVKAGQWEWLCAYPWKEK